MKKHIYSRLITLAVLLFAALQAGAVDKVTKTEYFEFSGYAYDNENGLLCSDYEGACWRFSGGDADWKGYGDGVELTQYNGGTMSLLSKVTFPETVTKVTIDMGCKAFST